MVRLTTGRGTGRRTGVWLVVLVAVVLVAGATAWGLGSSSLRSRVSVTIVPPQTDAGSATGQNPLLRLDGAVAGLAPVLAAAMRTNSARITLQQLDATATFSVSTETSTLVPAPAPVLRFTAESSAPASAQRTTTALISVARDQLDRLQTQAGVPGAARATLAVVAAPTPAARSDDRRWALTGRVALVAAVLVASAYLAVGRRGRRRAQALPELCAS